MSPSVSAEPVARVHNHFDFEIPMALESAAPLFGPQGERAWAEEWDPQFVYPIPARDTEGMIFTVSHGHTYSTWINTIFDPEKGQMQYVYFLPKIMATLIDVRLTRVDVDHTHVGVTYERTALDPEANEHVRRMGTQDAGGGIEWKRSIEKYLKDKRPKM